LILPKIADVIVFAAISGNTVCIKILTELDPARLSEYPNYLYVYYVNLVGPCLAMAITASTFWAKKTFRRAIREEFFNFVG
jgi:hypothetical protein